MFPNVSLTRILQKEECSDHHTDLLKAKKSLNQ